MQQSPKTMRTVGVHTPGGPDALEIINVPVPIATGGDLLIKVHAAGVNGADLREREGKYPVPSGAPARGVVYLRSGESVPGCVVVLGSCSTGHEYTAVAPPLPRVMDPACCTQRVRAVRKEVR